MNPRVKSARRRAADNLSKDPDYYKKMGRKGGLKTGVSKGTAHPSIDAVELGRKGGLAPRRRKK